MKKIKGVIDFYEKELREAFENSKINGNGTEKNPYIANDGLALPEKARIFKSDLHIVFENQKFDYITFIQCQNIFFKSCSFILFELHHSSHLSLDSCSIKNLMLTGVNNCNFERCSFKNVRNYTSYNNIFKACELTEILKGALVRSAIDLGSFIKNVYYLLALVTISLVSTISMVFFGFFDFFSVIIIGIVLIVLLIVQNFLKRAQTTAENRLPNKIID
jgi:hypothetical protein